MDALLGGYISAEAGWVKHACSWPVRQCLGQGAPDLTAGSGVNPFAFSVASAKLPPLGAARIPLPMNNFPIFTQPWQSFQTLGSDNFSVL